MRQAKPIMVHNAKRQGSCNNINEAPAMAVGTVDHGPSIRKTINPTMLIPIIWKRPSDLNEQLRTSSRYQTRLFLLNEANATVIDVNWFYPFRHMGTAWLTCVPVSYMYSFSVCLLRA